MVNLPKLKKEVRAFLTKEDGKMTKENLIKAGVIIAAFSAAAVMNSGEASAGHVDNCNPDGWVNDDCGLATPKDYSCADGLKAGTETGHTNEVNFNLQGNQPSAQHGHCADTFSWSDHANYTTHDEGGGGMM